MCNFSFHLRTSGLSKGYRRVHYRLVMAALVNQLSNLRIAPAVQPVRAKPTRPLQVCHARIANVEIPNNKCIRYSLQYIYGIGDTTAQKILQSASIEPTKRTYELSEEELGGIRDQLDNFIVEGDLRRTVSLNIKRLKEIGCYRGRRHYNSLPVRGQNTKNNARTRKGKKKMAIAGKK